MMFMADCPAGTYKPHQDPGDRGSCLACPLPGQTSPPGSSSAAACRCRPGHALRLGACRPTDCPPLAPPPHGAFIRNECQNVFNAACGVRCDSGYQVILNNYKQVCKLTKGVASISSIASLQC